VGFGCSKGSPKSIKIEKNHEKGRFSAHFWNLSVFGVVFDGFGDARTLEIDDPYNEIQGFSDMPPIVFGTRFGTPKVIEIGPKCSQNGPNGTPRESLKIFIFFNGSERGKRAEKEPKRSQKEHGISCFFMVLKRVLILGGFWEAFGEVLGRFWGGFLEVFGRFFIAF